MIMTTIMMKISNIDEKCTVDRGEKWEKYKRLTGVRCGCQ